jgi:hypothetical protein
MEITLLSDLKHHDVNIVVRVCVMRKWDFRGISDNGPIQHVDMVLADEMVQQLNIDYSLFHTFSFVKM